MRIITMLFLVACSSNTNNTEAEVTTETVETTEVTTTTTEATQPTTTVEVSKKDDLVNTSTKNSSRLHIYIIIIYILTHFLYCTAYLYLY